MRPFIVRKYPSLIGAGVLMLVALWATSARAETSSATQVLKHSGSAYYYKRSLRKGALTRLAAKQWLPAEPEANVNTAAGEGCPIETADGLSLMIASTRPGGQGALDIWSFDRESKTAAFGPATNLTAPINTDANDFCPSPAFGRYLLFVSDRTGADDCGGGDMFIARQNPAGIWTSERRLGCAPEGPNSSGAERSPWIVESAYGTFLFYSSNASGDHEIYQSRQRADGSFTPGWPVRGVNSDSDDFMPNVRRRDDGFYEMVFNSNRSSWGRRHMPAFGGQDVYISIARRPFGPWSRPRNLGEGINTPGNESRSSISTDGQRLHFGRDGDIFVSERIPGAQH